METKNKLQKLVNRIIHLFQMAKVTPTQIRYIFKNVREKGNYQVPKAKRKLPDFLNPAEIYQIRKVINEHFRPNDMFMFNFLIGTGLRISEFSLLMITDLDFDNNTIKVPLQTKTGNRYVPFPMTLQSQVKLFVNGRKRGYVYCKPNETKYTTRALQRRFELIFAKVKFPKKLHTHSLRHTYATILRANGVKIQDIQKYLGHASYKTTEIYAHLVFDMEQQKEVMRIVDNT